MSNFNDPRIVFEHQLRTVIKNVQAQIEAQTDAAYIHVSFEKNGTDDGKWRVNSWGNGTSDITTKGAVLHITMEEHIRRVNTEKGLTALPSLIGHKVSHDE